MIYDGSGSLSLALCGSILHETRERVCRAREKPGFYRKVGGKERERESIASGQFIATTRRFSDPKKEGREEVEQASKPFAIGVPSSAEIKVIEMLRFSYVISQYSQAFLQMEAVSIINR